MEYSSTEGKGERRSALQNTWFHPHDTIMSSHRMFMVTYLPVWWHNSIKIEGSFERLYETTRSSKVRSQSLRRLQPLNWDRAKSLLKGNRFFCEHLRIWPDILMLTCSSSKRTRPTITMLMFPPIVPSLNRLETYRDNTKTQGSLIQLLHTFYLCTAFDVCTIPHKIINLSQVKK